MPAIYFVVVFMLGVFLLDEDELGDYFDPIADPPTQEFPLLASKRTGMNDAFPVTTTRHSVFDFIPWPLEHMFAAVLNHIRQCATIPRYLIMPQFAYYRHLQDVYTPHPFDGIFSFHLSCMSNPYPIHVYQDVDFHMSLPIDTFLCIN